MSWGSRLRGPPMISRVLPLCRASLSRAPCRVCPGILSFFPVVPPAFRAISFVGQALIPPRFFPLLLHEFVSSDCGGLPFFDAYLQ